MPETGRIEYPFPSDLEGRMNAMLASINTELKCAAILALGDTAVDGNELQGLVREMTDSAQHLPRPSVFIGYCSTFIANGLVAPERNSDDTSTGYFLTKEGKKYGHILAAFTISWSAEHKKSIYSILGQTSSAGDKRAPFNRVKILKELEHVNASLNESELVDLTNLDKASVKPHLEALRRAGYVEFEYAPSQRGFVCYQWNKGYFPADVKTVESNPKLTFEVARALFELGEANWCEIVSHIGYNFKSAAIKISSILAQIAKQRVARRVKWKQRVKSEIRITPAGRDLVSNYLLPFEAMLRDNPDKFLELTRWYDCWSMDSDRTKQISKGIRMYSAVSPNMNKRPIEETYKELIDYVRNHPGAGSKEIDVPVRQHTKLSYLRTLVAQGKLRASRDENNHGALRYFSV